MSATSFTRPMLTLRNVFSSSLTISATFVDDTGTTGPRVCAYRRAACSVHAGVTPPTTLGMFRVFQSSFPGSTRSGENAR
jgi:hypothetical protein